MRMSEWNQTDNKTKCVRATPLHHTGAGCEERRRTEGSPPSCPNDTGPFLHRMKFMTSFFQIKSLFLLS